MLSTIVGCGKRLQWWAEVLEHSHPLYQQDIPYPSSMNINKFGSGSDLTSNTCNGASKIRHIIFEQVHEAAEDVRKVLCDDIRVLDVDFLNHL